jgi:hypothetical protein
VPSDASHVRPNDDDMSSAFFMAVMLVHHGQPLTNSNLHVPAIQCGFSLQLCQATWNGMGVSENDILQMAV